MPRRESVSLGRCLKYNIGSFLAVFVLGPAWAKRARAGTLEIAQHNINHKLCASFTCFLSIKDGVGGTGANLDALKRLTCLVFENID